VPNPHKHNLYWYLSGDINVSKHNNLVIINKFMYEFLLYISVIEIVKISNVEEFVVSIV